MNFKAVLFDLDGTLLNTIDDLGDSMNNVLTKLSYPTHSIESYKYFVGDGLEMLIKRALPEDVDEETFKKAYQLMRDEYGNNWANKTKPYDGIPELLNSLKSLGIRRTILTNKPDDTAQKVVNKFLSDYEFDIVMGARQNYPKKPEPDGAIEIAKALKIEPEFFLYLGDTKIDMETAKRAGMFPVGVLWGFRKADELINSGAKILIEHPINLLEYINNGN